MVYIQQKTRGVLVQVKDQNSNKSKSFTVHNIDHVDLYNILFTVVESLEKEPNDSVKMRIYKPKRVK